uniref:Uncharacterized protein n=1 Tax=Setaria digitata TaxID=48799 RepID=A0A915Q337_9BILA
MQHSRQRLIRGVQGSMHCEREGIEARGGEMRRGNASTRERRTTSGVERAAGAAQTDATLADAPADADAPSGRNIGQTLLCVDITRSLLDLSNTPEPRSPDSRSPELQTTTRSRRHCRTLYVTHCAPPATLFSPPHSLSLFMPDTKTGTHTHTHPYKPCPRYRTNGHNIDGARVDWSELRGTVGWTRELPIENPETFRK